MLWRPSKATSISLPDQSGTLRRVLRNSLSLYSAEFVYRLSLGLLTVVVARRLGSTETGKYIFVASLSAVAMTAADFGTTPYLIRSAVQLPGLHIGALLWRVVLLRLATAIFAGALLALYGIEIVQDTELRALLLFAAAALPLSAVGGTLAAALRAKERMGFEAGNRIFVALLTLTLGSALIQLGFGVTSLGAASLFAAFLSLLYYLYVPRHLVSLGRPSLLGRNELRGVIRGAWPFFSLAVLTVIYLRLDTVLIEHLLGPRALGEYGVAVRVMEVLFVIPGVLAGAIFPPIARNLRKQPEVVARRMLQAIKFLVFLSLPVSVVGSLVGPSLFPAVFGASFHSSGSLFRIMVWTLVPVFASSITSSIIAASRTPIANTYLAAGMIVINLLGNVISLPIWGVSGAAAVRLLTELSGLVGGAIFINARVVRLNYLPWLGRALASSVGSSIPLFLLGSINLPLAIVLFLVLYVALHWLGGAFNSSDRTFAASLLRNVTVRSW